MPTTQENIATRIRRRRAGGLVIVGLIVALLSAATAVSTAVSSQENCGCGQPSGIGIQPRATDALFVLNAALGSQWCDTCHCDVDASGVITVTDAFKVLLASIGEPVELTCSECQVPGVCGDGVVEGCEVCDTGSLNSDTEADACRSDCLPAYCGDGVTDTGESCDDGNDIEADGCFSDCTLNVCGDGVLNPFAEGCDNGVANSDTDVDACRTDCTPAFCGDGTVDSNEECDTGAANSDEEPGACRSDCSAARCGDGIIDDGEQCEPPGTASCTAICEFPTGRNLPAGFQDTEVIDGIYRPTAVAFAPVSDGRVFIASQPGKVYIFDGLDDEQPDVADLTDRVHFLGDRGMNGMALHPDFPTEPYLYLAYVLDAPIGMEPPVFNDSCPPGVTGCAVGARLSRFRVHADNTLGAEEVFAEDWCYTAPSHSAGDIVFGNDGALYVSGGDGASAGFIDYGQNGDPNCTDTSGVTCTPYNACGDPGSAIGQPPTPPTSQGGAFRSQDVAHGVDTVGFGGTVLRLDPATGQALADNPLTSNGDPGDDPIIAYGLRNPFRMAAQPGSDTLFIGDVGWDAFEEIDRIGDTNDAEVENFGWPCYEGSARQAAYAAGGFDICEGLYAEADTTEPPFYAYGHSEDVAPEDLCGSGGSAISALSFYDTGNYPSDYEGAMFFGDFARGCIWSMRPDAWGDPDVATRETFVYGAGRPVDIERGPNGDLFYIDVLAGTLRRIEYIGTDLPPIATAVADVTTGTAPLLVNFDATASRDPEGSLVSCVWDLDGDGVFNDSSSESPSYTYNSEGTYVVGVEVVDESGNASRGFVEITVGDTPPMVEILSPGDDDWAVGDEVSFSAVASDDQDGPLGGAAMSWELIIHHCPGTCHTHIVETFQGVANGTFTTPNHEYPSFLELKVTVIDSAGLTASTSVFLQPRTVALELHSEPQGLLVSAGSQAEAAPLALVVIEGSTNSISAPAYQEVGATIYGFTSWSDGGAASHDITATVGMAPFTATYTTE